MTKKKPIKCQKFFYQTTLHQGEYPQSTMFNVSSLPLDLKKVSIQLHESTDITSMKKLLVYIGCIYNNASKKTYYFVKNWINV